jgi:hypothetical protein
MNWLWKASRPLRPTSRRSRAARPAFEPLEGRRLLSTAIPLNASSWTPVGPAPILHGQTSGSQSVTGRITAIAAHPTDPNTIYVTGDSGGVWKTTDGGAHWLPLTDTQPTLGMGAIAVAPGNPNIVYAGTNGSGVLKSTNGGASWTLLGSGEFTGSSISQIVVSPASSNGSTVYVAVNGGGQGTGIWESTDGGTKWSNTTASRINTWDSFTDLVIDPTNSQVLFTAVGSVLGSPANGVYETMNGGGQWNKIATFPTGVAVGLIKLALYDDGRSAEMFASIVGTGQSKQGAALGSLFAMLKSTGTGPTSVGTSWKLLKNVPNYLGTQGWGDSTLAVDPHNPSVVYAGGQAGAYGIMRSTDGGMSWQGIASGADGNGPHADHHAAVFDAAGRLLDGNDGGIWRIADPKGPTWTDINGNLQLTEFISIALDPSNPDIAYGGSQDNGSEKFTGTLGWTLIGGGDGGNIRVDPRHAATVYSTTYGGDSVSLVRSDNGGVAGSWKLATTGISHTDAAGNGFGNPLPYELDPSNPSRLVLGTNTVYISTTRGDAWTPISTPQQVDKKGQVLKTTNGWATTAGVSSLAVAKSNGDTIYAATGDGHVFVTSNASAPGGAAAVLWSLRDVGPSDGVLGFEVDPTNDQIAYAVVGGTGHGHVYRTTTGGKSWTDISGNLPDLITHAIARDPTTGVLFVGNDRGVYGSADGGVFWSRVGTGLPNVSVRALELNRPLKILAAGTYGRGLWEMNIPFLGPTPSVHIKPLKDNCGEVYAYEADITNFARLTQPLTYVWTASPGATVNVTSSDLETVTVGVPANFPGNSVFLTVTVTDATGFQMTDKIQVPHLTPQQQLQQALWKELLCSIEGVVKFNPFVNPLWDPLRDLVADAPGGAILQLTAGQDAAGRLGLFALTGNGQIVAKLEATPGDPFRAWASLSGSTSGGLSRGAGAVGFQSFALGVNKDGRQELFALGQDHVLYEQAQLTPGGAWPGTWTRLAAPALKQVVAGQNKDGRLELFGVGLDGTLVASAQAAPSADRWSGWLSLHGPALKQVIVGQDADGRLQVFALSLNNAVGTVAQQTPNSNGWGSWVQLGDPGFTQIAAGRNADGRLVVFAVGADHALYQKAQTVPNGPWGAWAGLGGASFLPRQLMVRTMDDGRLQVVALGGGTTFFERTQQSPGGAWGDWRQVVDESLVASSRDVRARQGRAFTGTVASFFDLGAAGPADAYAATIAWGDGTVSTGTVTANSTRGFDVSGAHVYSRAGLFTVNVTIREKEGSTITVSYAATVLPYIV